MSVRRLGRPIGYDFPVGLSGNTVTTIFTSTPGPGTAPIPAGVSSIEVLVVGGGGGGGSGSQGGGGAAGGLCYTNAYPFPGLARNVTVTIGAGGSGGDQLAAPSPSSKRGANGTSSVFDTITAVGGGAGGAAGPTLRDGFSGGSGCGGSGRPRSGTTPR